MGAAAYDRGSKLISREFEADLAISNARAEVVTLREQNRTLVDRVKTLESRLRRAELSLRFTSDSLSRARSDLVRAIEQNRVTIQQAYSSGASSARRKALGLIDE